jgi:zinc protease
MRSFFLVTVLLLSCYFSIAQTNKNQYPDIDIPYKKFVLDNGLTLIVHEDHKAPVAAFNIWYHVGSKNEKPGKTGFAHLFEHLMFNGSEHYNKDYFQLMESIGATDLNGTTNEDRTNYFETFPVSALDKVLWAESDRMGYLLGVIDSARLNEQRGVVQNEKRQGENQPYAIADELTVKSTYPTGHPYSWTVIGSMEDLNAASLDDVKEWFKKYYGPNNAIVVIAGDVNTNEVVEKVKHYFGDIPASPPIAKHTAWVTKMTGRHYQVAQDRVPQARLQKTWNIPGYGTKEGTYLELLRSILADGKTSRLYKRLVYDDQLTSNVYAYTAQREIGGQLFIVADAKPGIELSRVESIIDEELQKVLQNGVTPAELERAKTRQFSNFVKGLERIGGFGGKSDVLAQNETFSGSADHYKQVLKWMKEATAADIKKQAADWISDGDYVLQILPFGEFKNSASSLNRNEQPALGKEVVVQFPETKQFKLSNGLNVYLVERNSVPVVNMSLMVNAGYAADQKDLAGLASMVGKMMKEGTATRSSLQISDQADNMGASIYSYSDLDNSYLDLSALKTHFDNSLNLYADILLHPSFPQKDFERVQKEQILNIKQEEAQPFAMGLRVLPELLYGKDHAYSNPFTGSGTEASVSKMTRNDLLAFHKSWYAPNNATLVVVGDVKENELKNKLEAKLGSWKIASVPQKNIRDVAIAEKPVVYIMDKPEAQQSIILAAEISTTGSDKDYESIKMMNRILGGEFTSRVNMNLREDKHWSYGSGSVNVDAKGPGFFAVYAPVQTDKTKESIIELQKELTDYIASKPATAEEFSKVKVNSVMQLPGIWETNWSVMSSLKESINYGRGSEYLKTYPALLQNMTLDQVQKAAGKVVKPNNLIWVIVGDKAKIEKGIHELNIGTVHYLTPQGKPIARPM